MKEQAIKSAKSADFFTDQWNYMFYYFEESKRKHPEPVPSQFDMLF